MPSQPQIELIALSGIPDVQPGDDVGRLLLDALDRAGLALQDGDVVAIAQKIVSKAEGRLVALSDVAPGEHAQRLAQQVGKDPRLVELILRESEEVSRVAPGVLVVRHRLGLTSANAGIDRSNVGSGGEERVLLLPQDPDASAARIRETLLAERGAAVGVVITDSHGRPFRLGTVGVAIGVAGLPALWDRRGEADRYGYRLQHTDVGVADEIAAAAGLLMGQAAGGAAAWPAPAPHRRPRHRPRAPTGTRSLSIGKDTWSLNVVTFGVPGFATWNPKSKQLIQGRSNISC